MAAGPLRRRVTFQTEAITMSGSGGEVTTWGSDLVVWGQFLPERGREKLEQGRMQARLAGTLRVRYSTATAAITAGHRVLILGVAYQIHSVSQEDGRNKWMVMVVERGAGT
jgi:SPP1 family predicted phage head-tail adaptor